MLPDVIFGVFAGDHQHATAEIDGALAFDFEGRRVGDRIDPNDAALDLELFCSLREVVRCFVSIRHSTASRKGERGGDECDGQAEPFADV